MILNIFFAEDELKEFVLNAAYLGRADGEAIKGYPKAALIYFCKAINDLPAEDLGILFSSRKFTDDTQTKLKKCIH